MKKIKLSKDAEGMLGALLFGLTMGLIFAMGVWL